MKKKCMYIGTGIICSLCIIAGVYGYTLNAESINNTEVDAVEKEGVLNEIGKYDKNNNIDEYDYLSDDSGVDVDNIRDKAEMISDIQPEMDENEVYDNMLEYEMENKAFYLAAVDAGYTASEEEIDDIINYIKDAIQGTEEEKYIKSYILGRGMREEEYWISIRDLYKRNLIIKKYLEDNMNDTDDKEEFDKLKEENIERYNVHEE